MLHPQHRDCDTHINKDNCEGEVHPRRFGEATDGSVFIGITEEPTDMCDKAFEESKSRLLASLKPRRERKPKPAADDTKKAEATA